MLGPPDTVVELGETEVSEEIFMEYLSALGESTYRSSSCYHAIFHPSPCTGKVEIVKYNVRKHTNILTKWLNS